MVKKTENLSFEESLGELEQIVTALEQGQVSLEDALKQFERGISLVRSSQQKLTQAQQKVAILLADDTAAPLTPFDAEDK